MSYSGALNLVLQALHSDKWRCCALCLLLMAGAQFYTDWRYVPKTEIRQIQEKMDQLQCSVLLIKLAEIDTKLVELTRSASLTEGEAHLKSGLIARKRILLAKVDINLKGGQSCDLGI